MRVSETHLIILVVIIKFLLVIYSSQLQLKLGSGLVETGINLLQQYKMIKKYNSSTMTQ